MNLQVIQPAWALILSPCAVDKGWNLLEMEGGWPLEHCSGGKIRRMRGKCGIRIEWKRTQSVNNNTELEAIPTSKACGSITSLQNRRGLETAEPRPLVVGAACFYPEPLPLCWEQPELFLPSSLSPPGRITPSNRSGRSSISLGSRTSDSRSWYLISNFSIFFSVL